MTSSTPGFQLDAQRRATDDKMIAGVASGIARALNIDPVIVRIGFVVLTFVGFAGPLLYLAGWLLVPAEGKDRSILGDAFDLQSDSQLRTIGLIAAATLAAVAVLGDTAWGPAGWFWWPMWALLWVAVPVGAGYWFLVVRPRQNAAARDVVPPPPYEAGVNGPSASAFAETSGATVTAPVVQDEPSDPEKVTDVIDTTEPTTELIDEPTPAFGDHGSFGAVPPTAPTSVIPPKPARPRWSPALLLVTLSAIVAAMGGLGLWSVLEEPVTPALYPAVALGIVAAGLLVGTKVGHPGALIPVGLLLVPALAVAAVVPNFSAGDINLSPTTAASIAKPIDQGFGRVHVDLTTITDQESLTGRTLEIRNGVGQTVVIVPDGLDVAVDASLSAGGRVEVFNQVNDSANPSITRSSDAPGAYRIEINGTVGEIVVMRQ